MVLVHLATLTGSWQDIRRLTPQDFPDKPTMFEYYRKALKKDEKSCYFITSKHEFDYMNFSNHQDYGEDFAATCVFTKEKNNDEELYNTLVSYMKTHHPSLVFVILGGAQSFNKIKRPEEVKRYRKQLKEMDKNIEILFTVNQELLDKTNCLFNDNEAITSE
jgi:hypothetical protein